MVLQSFSWVIAVSRSTPLPIFVSSSQRKPPSALLVISLVFSSIVLNNILILLSLNFLVWDNVHWFPDMEDEDLTSCPSVSHIPFSHPSNLLTITTFVEKHSLCNRHFAHAGLLKCLFSPPTAAILNAVASTCGWRCGQAWWLFWSVSDNISSAVTRGCKCRFTQ